MPTRSSPHQSEQDAAEPGVIGPSPTAFVEVNGVRLAYDYFGDADDPTVLLIMGLRTQMIAWHDDFCRLLVARGLHVVRFDNRDVGLSSRVPHPFGRLANAAPLWPAFSLADMATDTAALIEALDLAPVHVVGVSMGGMIAQTLAIRYPALVASLTSMSSTTGNRLVGRARPDAALRVALTGRPATRAEAVEAFVTVLRIIGSPGYPIEVARLREAAGRAYDRTTEPPNARHHVAAVVTARDRTGQLAAVGVPSLVIHGADDPLIHVSGGRATARALPDSRLVVIPGMGHDLAPGLWPVFVDEISDVVSRGQLLLARNRKR